MADPKMKVLNYSYKFPWVPGKFTNSTYIRGEDCFVKMHVDPDSLMKEDDVIDEDKP